MGDRTAVRAIAAGAVIRVVYGLILHPPLDYLYSDMGGYVARATRLASGHHVPRADYFMPFGTQLLISLPMRVLGDGRAGLWGASVLWCALSCAFPVAAWAWARTFLNGRGAAAVAAGCALCPLPIVYGGYFSSELPAMVLLATVLWLVARSPESLIHAALAGTAVAALVAVRQQFALNVVIAGFLPLAGRRLASIAAARQLATAAVGGLAGLVLVVAVGAPPWQVTGGLPPLFGQNGGVNFYYGHCDVHTLTMVDLYFQSPVEVEDHRGHDVRLPGRLSTDQGYLYRRGLDCVTRDPARAVVIAARSTADMSVTAIPFPPYIEGGAVMRFAQAANLAFCLMLLVLIVNALRRPRRRIPMTLLAHLGCAVLVAVVYLGEPRYRLPYDLFGWALLGWVVAAQPSGRGGEDDPEGRSLAVG